MSSNNNVAIRLDNVSKRYFVHHEKPTFMESLLHGKNESFWAIKNLKLTINKGQIVGFIGPNGCGKTTLLKIITGISTPTSGKVEINGKIVSLIDLQAGFHPDMTGIENIYLNGSILGMTRNEIDKKIKDIISFADIGKFIDSQIFTYSSGMVLRLGFSIAIHTNPDILILDENISVGDQGFIIKSYEKIHELFKEGKTILLASHDLVLLKNQCDRICWLDHGKIRQFGLTKKVIDNYTNPKVWLEK